MRDLISIVTESSAEERANIVQHIENEYRLSNIAEAMPPEHLHPVVKRLLRDRASQVTIYRGVPLGVDEIRPGDWVSLTPDYASQHGAGHVISRSVPVSDVAWAGTDKNEYYFVPTNR